MKKVLIYLIMSTILAVMLCVPVDARTSGRTSTSRSGSTGRTTASKSTKSGSTYRDPSKRVSTAKPGSTVVVGGKAIKTSDKKPKDSKYKNSKGVIGDNGYMPALKSYTPPAGSVVYQQDRSPFDYLPWIYLFSSNSPQYDKVVVVEPDGKEVVADPAPGANDGMVVFNWFVLITGGLALIALVVYFVNKR